MTSVNLEIHLIVAKEWSIIEVVHEIKKADQTVKVTKTNVFWLHQHCNSNHEVTYSCKQMTQKDLI